MKKEKYYRIYKMDSIDNILQRFLSYGGIDIRLNEYESVIAFNNLDDKDKMGCRAIHIKDGKLYIEAPNNSAANLLSLKKDSIIQKINENVQRDNVKDIIFSLNINGDY